MCVCCSLGIQRSPPLPQGSTGTSCWRELVQTHVVLVLEAPIAAHCSNLQVSGHVLVSSHSLGQFWCSEKLLLQFKETNRWPEGEYKMRSQADTATTSNCKLSGQPRNPQCLICWVCFAHGPAQFVEIWQTQMLPAHKHSALSWQTQRLQPARQPCKLWPAASHKMLSLVSLAEGCSSHSCYWKYPKKYQKSLFHGEHPKAMEMPFGK